MRRHIKWLVPAVLVVAVAVILSVRMGASNSSPSQDAASSASPAGKTAKASREDISVRLSETGVIQPKSMVLVKSKVSGKISRLQVRDGQGVSRGGLLAVVEPDMAQARTVAALKSEYGRAKVDLERTRQDYERDLELHQAGHISESQVQLARDDYEIAKIQYQSALEQMRLAEEDGVTMDIEAETAEFLDILAPASGTVINMEIEEGELVTSGAVSSTSGTTLMTIADLSVLQIKAGVNEVDIGKVRDGQDVAVDVDAYPGIRYSGRITHVAPAARDEDGVKIFDVEIDIENGDERLRPGMTANIEIQGEHREDVVTVPIEAAFRKEGRFVVYVFDENGGGPEERAVETGVANIDRVEIVSGLEEGETVALYDPEIEGQAPSEDDLRRQRMASAAGGR